MQARTALVAKSQKLLSAADIPQLLTIPQAARLIGVTQWAVRKAIKVGALPGARFGYYWFTTLEAVEGYKVRRGQSKGRPGFQAFPAAETAHKCFCGVCGRAME